MNKAPMFLLLALLSAFPPLATDMYLPAIPLLQQTWQQPLTVVNLTLVGFFVSYCLFLLGYGPLSDRFGRRPPLLFGISLFIVASLGCSLATGVTSLIIARILQAAGAAAAATLAMAISKDVYPSNQRARVLAWIGVIMALAPAVAPVIGSWMLAFLSWRWIFVFQAAIAAIAGFGVLRMDETLTQRTSTSALASVRIYLELLTNKRYIGYALLVSLVVLPHFAFIAGSADIYISRLGLSEQQFGYLFGLNALAFMAGSLLCTRLLPRLGPTKVMTLGYSGLLLGGLGIVANLLPAPWNLAVPMSLVTFSLGLSRPPSNNLVLDQVEQHAGAASSLLVFIFFILGALSMWFISLNWSNKIEVIGWLASGSGGLILGTWLWLNHRKSAS